MAHVTMWWPEFQLCSDFVNHFCWRHQYCTCRTLGEAWKQVKSTTLLESRIHEDFAKKVCLHFYYWRCCKLTLSMYCCMKLVPSFYNCKRFHLFLLNQNKSLFHCISDDIERVSSVSFAGYHSRIAGKTQIGIQQ